MEDRKITQKKRKKSNPHANLLEKKQKQESEEMGNLFNQISIAKLLKPPKFKLYRCLQPSEGKSVVEPTEHIDIVDQAIGIFHEEIIMEILCRLPVRSLHRFKCVSKFWKALISDPYFKRKHLNRAKNDQNFQKFLVAKKRADRRVLCSFHCSSLSSVQLVEDEQKLNLPLNWKPGACTILCCCDGLVLLAVFEILVGRVDEHLVLWNPSTRESIALPCPEPSLKGCVCGLGYDTASDDYKILKIDLNERAYHKVSSEILVLKSGSWRICKYPKGISRVFGFIDSGTDSLAFVHGAFHWLGLKQYHNKAYTIVSFDISNEVYGEIPLLEQMCYAFKTKKDMGHIEHGVSVLGGMLCFYSSHYNGVYLNGADGTYKLWVMKDYGVRESWAVLFTVQDTNLCYSAIPKYRYADGEVLLCLRHVLRLNCIYRTSRGPFELWPQDLIVRQGIAYTESLISPKLLA